MSQEVQLTRDEREDITVDPIPRKVNPVHHAGRREARPRAIFLKVDSGTETVLFVDAAQCSTRRAFGVSVIDGKGQLVSRASVCTDKVTIAEVATALALQAAKVPCVIYSNQRSTVRSFSGGLISQQGARLIQSGHRQARRIGGQNISWFPGHVGGANPNASTHTLHVNAQTVWGMVKCLGGEGH